MQVNSITPGNTASKQKSRNSNPGLMDPEREVSAWSFYCPVSSPLVPVPDNLNSYIFFSSVGNVLSMPLSPTMSASKWKTKNSF